ncbi:MAG: TIGR03943 family putative permease subunit [Cyanobium sp.]
MANPLLRGLALALWAVVLLQSSVDGRLDLLLRADFHPLVSAAGGVLLVLALLQVLAGLRGESGGESGGRRDGRLSLATAAIALLLILWPPNPSFADLASQRPGDDTANESLSFVLPPTQRSLTDWVRLLRSQPDPQLFDGDPVRISGFLLPVPGQPPQIARLLVRCCLADATPVGLPVRWPSGQPLPRADQWLAIEGTMAADGDQPVVVPATIRPIPRPARPLEP